MFQVKQFSVMIHGLTTIYAFNVDKVLLGLFYESCIVSLFCFCINAWGGNLRARDKYKFNRVIKRSNKLANITGYKTFDDWLLLSSQRKLAVILKDSSHPLHSSIQTSPRSGRLLHITTKTQRHLNSFLPYAVRNNSWNNTPTHFLMNCLLTFILVTHTPTNAMYGAHESIPWHYF